MVARIQKPEKRTSPNTKEAGTSFCLLLMAVEQKVK